MSARTAAAGLDGPRAASLDPMGEGPGAPATGTGADRAAGWPGFLPLLRGPQVWPTPGGWDQRAIIDDPDASAAGAHARTAVESGAMSLLLRIAAGGEGEGRGVVCAGPAGVAAALEGVVLEAAPVHLRAGGAAPMVAGWLDAVLEGRGLPPERVRLAEGCDPLGAALSADPPADVRLALSAATERAQLAWQAKADRTVFLASGMVAADGGADEAAEIGWLVSAGTEYLRSMLTVGLPPAAAASLIELEVFADVDLFATVAKIRALRRCWATVLAAVGVPSTADGGPHPMRLPGVRVHAIAGGRWLSPDDPWSNAIRGTIAALGAVLGGTDSLAVESFDAAGDERSDLGRRLALTTGLVLAHECGLGRLLDPTGGSHHVTELSDQFAAAGWAQFQQVEAGGGCLGAVADGAMLTRLTSAHATGMDPA